jgi:hypothetical protein
MALLVDAICEIARRDVPGEWARYCEIAPRIWSGADAARELLLRARLTNGRYDGTLRNWGGGPVAEARALEDVFLTAFVTAVHAGPGRCSVWGVPYGESTVSAVDPRLVTVAAFKCIKGDEWKLGGTVWHIVDVIVGPPPRSRLRTANDLRIHDALKAVYDNCKATGLKLPNVNEPELIQDYLRKQGFSASGRRIRELAGDPRYDGLRREPGRTLASERRKAGKKPPGPS